MTLQWYPGHMTKARRELVLLLPTQHFVIEVLDARLPASSQNPMLAELRGNKPCVKVLTKADLADPEATAAWIAHLQRETTSNVFSFAATTNNPVYSRKMISIAAKKFGFVYRLGKPVRAVIAGVPNVGKSTLINMLMERNVAATGDKPAVTKKQQRVELKDHTVITDSPGMMWPKIENESDAMRLAFAGSIPSTAIDFHQVAMFGADYLLANYGAIVAARYKLDTIPANATELLDQIARRRGGLRAGGNVDLHQASEIFIHDFRSGKVGAITLELPPVARPHVDGPM
jgi:ribosome biogenesis GTPase A